MEITITIPENTDELTELQAMVAESNQQNPNNLVTAEEYVNNIVNGYLENRVRNAYLGFVNKQSTAALKQKIGNYENVRSN